MLVSIAYLTLLGLILGQICMKGKLPALVGMLVTGMLLGPYGFDVLSPKLLNISFDLRQWALIIILMRAGLALDFDSLRKVGRPAILLCFVPACFEIAAMVFIAPRLLDISILDAAIMGCVVAAVSPAVVVPKMLNLIDKGIGTKKGIPQMIMAGGSVDDIFVIVLFTIFTTLGGGGDFNAAELAQIPVSITLGLIVGFVSGYLSSLLFEYVEVRDSV